MLNKKTGLLAPKNRKFLLAGLAAAAIGTYLLAGDKIKAFFKKDETPEPRDLETQPVIAPAPVIVTQPVVTQTTSPIVTGEPLDIYKQLRPGVTGEEVWRLQYIINDIAGLRGTKSYKPKASLGKPVTFPIAQDRIFGEQTNSGLLFIDPIYQDKKYTDLDKARNKWAYIRGYYGVGFPSSLANVANAKKYRDSYKTGEIDRAKKK